MRVFLSLLLLTLFSSTLSAQHLVQGRLLDENKEPLIGATVVLLEPIDSSMVAFAISDSEGLFALEDISTGQHVLQVSFVSYSSIQKEVFIPDDQKKVELGDYILEPITEVLQEVTVKAEHIPMGVIGDTISYNAAAFKTKPGASVEDLLKQLPGVEVRRDGSIKAMGEDVENVLVDGKEFFGSDPKVATKNLDAEAVDKVQVFDKKSEIAEFTGIDDGAEEKTINLKLKEEYKKGGFGRAAMTAGTKSTYDGKLAYNRFSPKMQTAVLLSANNINKQAFSFNEYISFIGGLGSAISGNMSGLNFGEFGGRGVPQGITDHISTGLNFSYDVSSKLKIESHYLYSDSDQDLQRQTRSTQFTENLDFSSIDNAQAHFRNKNHRIQAKLAYQPNPFTQVKWNNILSFLSNNNTSIGTTDFENDGILTNSTSTDVAEKNLQKGIEGSLVLRRKYKKKGRSWINTVRYQYGVMQEDVFLNNQFSDVASVVTVNQNQDYDYSKSGLSFNTAYTEPLSKKTFLSGSYMYEYDQESPQRLFFDSQDERGILIHDLSRSFEKKNNIHRGQINLRRNAKKIKLSGGIGLQSSKISGAIKDEMSSPIEDLNNSSFYILPQFKIDLEFTRNASLDINYQTSVTLPTLQQLAPLPDNSNPNLLIVGNPNLRPAYTHALNLHFRSIDQFNFKSFFAQLNLSLAQERVINAVSVADNLIRTIRPINTDQFMSLRGYLSYAAPIRSLKLKFKVYSDLTIANYESFLNDRLSGVDELISTFGLTISNRKKEHLDIATGIDFNFTDRNYALNSDFGQSFFNYSVFLDGIVYIAGTWSIASKYDYRSFSSASFSEGRSFHLLSASLEKSFKGDRFAITLSANDLLNQRRGVERSGGLNSLYDINFNTRARFIMLGLKVKLGRKKDEGLTL